MSPSTDRRIRIAVAGADVRSLASSLADGLSREGLDVSSRRLSARTGDWLVTAQPINDKIKPEAVIVPDQASRSAIESHNPDVIGDVWVWDGTDRQLPGMLASRYRPTRRYAGARVGVIGYNLKFFRPIEQHLRRLPGVEVRVAEWPKFAVGSPQSTEDVLEWASVIMCEWAGPNAAIASRRRRPDQRLVVRFHRFELERDEWRDILIDQVDTVVAVGEPYRRRILETTEWPEERLTVIPNLVDLAQMDRPKVARAALTLGLLGGSPWRKRPDRALDVLEELRHHDPRWRLHIKGARPEEERWRWEDADYAARYETQFRRMEALGHAVVWDPAGPDVAEWFRSVGHILSTSDDESFHLAPAEGMASGTLPVIWPWPGSDEIYEQHWIVDDPAAAANAILSRNSAHRAAARREVARFGRERVLPQWEQLLLPVESSP